MKFYRISVKSQYPTNIYVLNYLLSNVRYFIVIGDLKSSFLLIMNYFKRIGNKQIS